MRYFLPFFLLMLLFLSCQSTGSRQKQAPPLNPADSFNLLRQQKFAEIARLLQLPAIEKNVDSFELRLWVSSMIVEHTLIILRHTNSSWQARRIVYYKGEDGRIHMEELPITSSFPQTILIDSLRQMDFAGMLSQEQIPGFKDNIADGIFYHLEIAIPHRYRLISYHCPEQFAKAEPHHQQFMRLVYLLDRYFQFWTPVCV